MPAGFLKGLFIAGLYLAAFWKEEGTALGKGTVEESSYWKITWSKDEGVEVWDVLGVHILCAEVCAGGDQEQGSAKKRSMVFSSLQLAS